MYLIGHNSRSNRVVDGVVKEGEQHIFYAVLFYACLARFIFGHKSAKIF